MLVDDISYEPRRAYDREAVSYILHFFRPKHGLDQRETLLFENLENP